jgi:hypothetical protein
MALAFCFLNSTCHIGACFDILLGTSTIIISPLQRTDIQLVFLYLLLIKAQTCRDTFDHVRPTPPIKRTTALQC